MFRLSVFVLCITLPYYFYGVVGIIDGRNFSNCLQTFDITFLSLGSLVWESVAAVSQVI